MSTAASTDARIREVQVTRDEIVARLADGRVISVPLAWSWRLSEATAAQRANFRIIGTGQGVHWPDLDEDISVEGMLHGSPAPRPKDRGVTGSGEPRAKPAPNTRMQPARTKQPADGSRPRARG
jgi:hypothetical protein